MASKVVLSGLKENKDGTWNWTCPVTDGTCGDRAAGTSYHTDAWDTKTTALARAQEHVTEHKEGKPMSSLEEFRKKHGLVPSGDGRTVVSAKDL